MDFFGRQAETRRLTRWLVILFVLAVLAVVVAVNAVVLTVVAILGQQSPALLESGGVLPDGAWLARNPVSVLITTLSVLGIIGLASLYKTASLSSGGGAVAKSLGGERVTADTTDPLRRRLLNVVEEMAIASGVPVPEVYVLEQESAINAFAAGYTPANAAIAVTRGTLVNLNRSELQGVVAHEFAHVLNGDMRLNTRLIGLLFGLVVIALIARLVLHHAPRGGGGRKGGGAVVIVFVAAFAVLALGYVGLFFGRIIQAAVSRTRESLADASAVQFTRDPTGIRDALVKIGALAQGSRLVETDAQEVAHMLFAPGVKQLMASHPPLVPRIRAIDPRFDPREFEAMRTRMLAAENRAEAAAEQAARPTAAERLRTVLGAGVVLAPGAVAELVGNPGTAHVRLAGDIRASLPAALADAAGHPGRASGLFLALALDREPETRSGQLASIAGQLGAALANEVESLLPQIDALSEFQRMPALFSVFPALHQLARSERAALLSCLTGLLEREGRVSINAYALRKLAQVQLRDDVDPPLQRGNRSLEAASGDLQVLFSVLAASGNADPATARRAYEVGMHQLLPMSRPAFVALDNWPAQLDAALNRLDQLAPAAKELLVEALTRTIAHDMKLTVAESELLRAICASLHCPLPPLVAGIGISGLSPA
jgi:Zn-dependent protease with chaperone function